MTAVRFDRRGDQYAVSFAYNADLVALVKTVPSFARSWQPTGKVWLVASPYAEQLARDMSALGYIVVGVEPPQQRQYAPDDVSRWAHLLFKRVGQHRADQVFRSLSKCFHPDLAGGDAQLQRELTDARNELADQRKETA